MWPRTCQPRVMRCTRAAASARGSSPAAAKTSCSFGSDSEETGSRTRSAGGSSSLARNRAAGWPGIAMSARRLGAITPLGRLTRVLLPPLPLTLKRVDDRDDDDVPRAGPTFSSSDAFSLAPPNSSTSTGVSRGNFDLMSTRPCHAFARGGVATL